MLADCQCDWQGANSTIGGGDRSKAFPSYVTGLHHEAVSVFPPGFPLRTCKIQLRPICILNMNIHVIVK